MKAVRIIALLLGLHGTAYAEDPVSPALTESSAATPSVGGSVRGEPNLYDLEFATARLTLRSPDKTLTAVTVAPFLRPPYNRWISETRIGMFAETSGAFGLGVAWGYNQARARLASEDLPTLDEKTIASAAANLRGPLAVAIQIVCVWAKAHNTGTTDEQAVSTGIDNICQYRDSKSIGASASMLVSDIKNKVQALSAHHAPVLVDVSEILPQLEAALKAYEEGNKVIGNKGDDDLLRTSRADRLERAYKHSFGLNVIAAVGSFPYVDAPKLSPPMGASTTDAYAHTFRNVDIGGAARFYVSRTFLVQVRGGRRWDRANAMEDTKLTGEYYGGLDLAAIKLFGKGPDETGFQPGIGGGLSVLEYRCSADGGCSTDLELGDPYPKTFALDHRTQLTAFVEWRARKEFQVRLTVDAFVDKVKGQIPGTEATDASPRLIHIIPSISVGASFWGL